MLIRFYSKNYAEKWAYFILYDHFSLRYKGSNIGKSGLDTSVETLFVNFKQLYLNENISYRRK